MTQSTPAHRIVCTDTLYSTAAGHSHIVSVGIGDDPNRANDRLSVAQVRLALDNGEVFYTVSPSTNKVAIVSKYTCGCGYKTIRSHADAITDNNLDNLRLCHWTSS